MAVKDGVMVTESRNLEYTGILKVVERQVYRRPSVDLVDYFGKRWRTRPGFGIVVPEVGVLRVREDDGTTDVSTKIELHSRFGEGRRRRLRRMAGKGGVGIDASEDEEVEVLDPEVKVGFFASLTQGSLQRSIEAIGLKRAERSDPNSKKGMNIVLERLRHGGLVGVFEGMRIDRESALAGDRGVDAPLRLEDRPMSRWKAFMAGSEEEEGGR